MKASVFAYSKQGIETAAKILSFFEKEKISANGYVPQRLSVPGFAMIPQPSGPLYKAQFEECSAMVFVGSCGIAVREIAPFVADKRTDPAVLCIDELGRFVIPLLSGHIGGANQLAKALAGYLGAQEIITTATDIRHKFSVDAWAARTGFVIGSMSIAKDISAAILEHDIPIMSSLPVCSPYPEGTYPSESGKIGIFIGWEQKTPFEETLQIIPPILTLGIGCRKGTGTETIRQTVNSVLAEYSIDRRAICAAASIDLKSEEPGLLAFCKEEKIELRFYSADTLRKVHNTPSHSDFVEHITGVDNVCERAAMVCADRLIVPKTARSGVTVAVGAKHTEVHFE